MRQLPDSEWELMKIIWRADRPISRMEIEAQWSHSDSVLPNTTLTLLSRLEKRGFVKKTKNGKTNLYSAVIREESYYSHESRRFMKRIFNNSMGNFMNAFYDGKRVSEKDVEELEAFLRKIKDDKAGTKSIYNEK